jgi:cytoskeletal protein CcmA (bactofilin family)
LIGQLHIDGDVRLGGTVEGQIEATGDVEIDDEARVNASLVGRDVTIRGHVNGPVTARKRLVVAKNASLTGDVRVARLAIADGATFSGNVSMGAPTEAAAKRPEPAPTESQPAAPPAPRSQLAQAPLPEPQPAAPPPPAPPSPKPSLVAPPPPKPQLAAPPSPKPSLVAPPPPKPQLAAPPVPAPPSPKPPLAAPPPPKPQLAAPPPPKPQLASPPAAKPQTPAARDGNRPTEGGKAKSAADAGKSKLGWGKSKPKR